MGGGHNAVRPVRRRRQYRRGRPFADNGAVARHTPKQTLKPVAAMGCSWFQCCLHLTKFLCAPITDNRGSGLT